MIYIITESVIHRKPYLIVFLWFQFRANSGILSDISAIQEEHVKQSLGAKNLLFPTPILMVGTYHQVNGYHGVGPLLGMAFTVGKKIG